MKVVVLFLMISYPLLSFSNLTEREKLIAVRLCLSDLMRDHPQAFNYAELNYMLIQGNVKLDKVAAEDNILAQAALREKIITLPWVVLDD